MEYHLSPSDDGQYILIEVVGDFSRADAMEITQAAFALGAKLGIRCYLNDVTRARNTDPVVENVRFARVDRQTVESRDDGAYTAVLVDPTDHSHDFLVAAAQSQGIGLEMFWDRDKAIQRLCEVAAALRRPDSQNLGDTD